MNILVKTLIGVAAASVVAIGSFCVYRKVKNKPISDETQSKPKAKKKTKSKSKPKPTVNRDSKRKTVPAETESLSMMIIVEAKQARKLYTNNTILDVWFKEHMDKFIAMKVLPSDEVYSEEDKLDLDNIENVDWFKELVYIRLSGTSKKMKGMDFTFHTDMDKSHLPSTALYKKLINTEVEKGLFIPLNIKRITSTEKHIKYHFDR